MAARHGRGSRRRTSLAAVRTGLAGALVGSLLLLALPAAAATVPILAGGPPVTIDVSTPGDTATLTFEGSVGQRVSLDVSEVTIGTSTCCSTKISILKPDGKPLVALTLGTNGGFIDTTSLPAAGTYSIVVDPQSTNIGGATLTLYNVPPDVSAAIVPGGAPVAVSTAVPGQNARVTFAGTSGERVSLDVSDVTVGTSACCSTKVSILKPDGKTLAAATVGTNGGFIDTQTLPSTGTYTILVDPQGSAGGDATLTLYDVPADATATIAPGGPDVTVSTTVPGQNARVTFDGVAGQRVSLDLSEVTIGTSLCCGIKVSIVRASGTVIAGPSTFGTLGGFVDTVSLPATGTYTILVDPQGSASGDATLTLYDVPADATATIAPGGPDVTVSTTVPGQNARVTFLGVSGQRVSLEISGVSMGPSTCCSVKVSILKPNGSLLAGPVTAGTSGGFLDTSTLPTSGTYTIVVDPQGGATGDASLTLYDVPADTFGSIVVGGPAASVGTSMPGQNAALTFSGTAGQRISLAVGPTCCSTKISILKPNSTVLASATFGSFGGFLDATTLPTTGTYTIAVDPQGPVTGDVTVRLYNVPGDATGTIRFGSSTTVTTTVPGQNATVSFTASAGQRMSLRIGPTCCAVGISVLKPNSSTLVTPTTIGTNGGFIDTTVLPTAGTYTIVIDLQSAATGSITLSLFDVPTDATGTIAFGSPTTVTTTVPGQNGAVTFAGTAGQRVSVKIGPGCCTTKVSILKPDSSVLASLTSFAVLEGFIDTTVLPVTGTYTIAVDPSGSSVGATTLTLYDVPADVADTITFGSSRTETLSVPGQNARVTFAGTAGQVASLQLTGVTIGNSVLSGTTVSILRPDSIVLASVSVGTNGGFIDSKTLPVTGEYTILVDPQGANTGSITLTLADVPVDATGTIVPGGAPLTVTTTISGQDARISFSGSAGQRVSLQVGSNCCLAQFSILNPDGSPLAGPTSFGTGGGFIDSKTLPVNGDYTILFDPQGAATGSVTLTLYDVPPDAANTITPAGPAVGVTTTVPGQNAKLTFAGTSGQRVSVKVNPGCCIATYSVLDPDGSAVAPPVGFGTGGGFIDTMTLSATGTYSIVVNPQGAVTGSVTINLYDVPLDVTGTAVLGGAAVTVATTTPGQNALITFTGAENDGVSVVVGPFNCCSTRVSVLNPDGTTLAGPVAFNPDGGTMVARLPAAGTYTLAVDPQGAGFGSLHLRLAIDNTAPVPPVLSLSETSADGHVSGATYFYRPGGSGGTFTVTATASDPGTGIQKMTFAGLAAGFTPTIVVEDKIVPYSQTYAWLPGATYSSASNTVTAYDNVGNTSSANFVVVPDVDAPTTSDNIAAIGSGWKNTDQFVTLSALDGSGSGSARSHYTTDGSTPTTSSSQGTAITLSAEGVYTVKYFSIDNVGNVEAPKTAGTQIRIDKTNPTSATLGALPAVIKNGQTLTGSGSDALSGLGSVAYYYCAGSSCTPSTLIGTSSTAPSYTFTWSSQPADGTYQVLARAIDVAGNTLNSVKQTITIDNTPPTTTITAKPANPINSTSASFSFTASEPSSFQCQLDGSAFASCSSPVAYSGLAAGSHTFGVRATDAIGNVGAAATYTWTIDTTPPDTTITSSPANPTNSTSPSFSFSSSESGSTFQCSLDGGAFAGCTSPRAYTGLAPGNHTFQVKATDPAGNVDPTPASYTWTIDTAAPDTTITSSPANPTNSTSPSFSFSSSESGSAFQCSLDGAAFVGCTSPRAYTGLAPGSHTFQVKAMDAAGNTDPTPASYTWTIDTAAPDTTITSSPANPTNSTSASFSFSSSEGGSSFECQLDGGGYSSCATPKAYSGLAPGSHTFQVRAMDAAGNTDLTPASYTWTIDTTAPNTTITASPANPTNSTSASFSFNSTEAGSFECELDGAAFTGCTSPKAYAGLAVGNHTFQVRSTDTAGNTDPTPASFTWTIDIAAPDTTITASPANPTNSTSASFSFSSSEGGSTFECQLDGGGYSSCASPKPYSGLAPGSHTFQARATDQSGNTDPTPASHTWTIDTAAPDTTITSSPANPTNSTSASFSFSSSEGGSTFECQLDGGGYVPCASPVSYSGLGEGTHSFQVKATDPAGNTDPAPASYGWTVDTSPPDTAIGLAPPNPTNATGATFSFTSSEGGSSFACSLDGAVFTPCAAPASYSALGDGSHNFQVRATDAAGNTDATPASRTWTIDTTPPAAPVIENPPQGGTNNTGSFTLAGTAEPSATVEVFEGAASRGTTTASGAGSWAKALISVADGSHTYTARATDAAGNVSAVSNARTVVVDTRAPNTDILAGPSGSTASTTAIFSFSADDPAATFECSLDGAAFNSCTSPKTYTALGEGAHAFDVRATDQAGNTDPTPAIRSWTVDLTAPAAPVITSPPDGTTSNTGTFTVSGTVEAGAVVEVFDGATSKGTVSATGGTWSKAFAGVADGSHTYTAIARDTAGNTSAVSNSRTVIVDTTPPNTSVDSGPAASTNQTTATLTFSSSEGGSSFNCRLDGAAFASCTSPLSYSSLAEGSHTFEVKATDAAGNIDATPATRSWTVDTTAPGTTVDSGPGDPTNATGASFGFNSSEAGSSFECSLDGSAFVTCSSPAVYSSLPEGPHTFEVKATDAVGNTDPTPASYAWTVDTSAPETSVDSGPADPTTDTDATFAFSSSETGSTFQCSLDGGPFASCSSPDVQTALEAGSHTFEVRAIDPAGNTDQSPASHAWTIT